MSRIIIAAVAAASLGLAAAQSASAADMPVKAPVGAPIYNWSGFYIGGDLGWQGSSIGLSNAVFGVLTYSPTHSSFAYGGFAGYQHQFGQFVLGVEGGYTAANGSASLGAVPSISIFFPAGTGTASAKLKDIWNIGGRIGWAMGNWLPYLTGGYASGRFGFDAASPPLTETATAKSGGGYIGGGLEWAVWRNVTAGSDLIIGVEYRHYGFRTTDVTTTLNPLPATETVRFSPKTDAVMGRVSFKFGN